MRNAVHGLLLPGVVSRNVHELLRFYGFYAEITSGCCNIKIEEITIQDTTRTARAPAHSSRPPRIIEGRNNDKVIP